MAGAPIDYEKLAEEARRMSGGASGAVDYEALANGIRGGGQAGPTVPGMEKLGALPGVGVLPPPGLMNTGQQSQVMGIVPAMNFGPPTTFDRRTGTALPVDDPSGMTPAAGLDQAGGGITRMSRPELGEKMGGLSDTMRGLMTAVLPFAVPSIGAAAVTAPLKTAVGFGAGLAGQQGGEAAATMMGLPPGAAQLTGDISGIVAGVGANNMIGKTKWGAGQDPHLMMVQATKPPAGLTNYKRNLELSMPELKQVEAKLGRQISNLDDLLGGPDSPGAIQLAKQANREQYKQLNAGAGDVKIDGRKIANEIRSVITKKLRLEDPEKAKTIETLAAKYDRPIPIEDAQSFLLTTNAELSTYYGKNPSAKGVAVRANPDTAILDAQAEALRDGIYKALDAPGGGAAARALQKRYGALMELENVLYRRYNVVQRQQPDSLSEQLSRWASAGELMKGAAKLAHWDIPGAAGDVMSAVGKRYIAKVAKERQTTDALIKRAFAKYDRTPELIVMPVGGPAPFNLPPTAPYNPSGAGIPQGQEHLKNVMYGKTPPAITATGEVPGVGAPNIGGQPITPIDPGLSNRMYGRAPVPFVEQPRSSPGVGGPNIPESGGMFNPSAQFMYSEGVPARSPTGVGGPNVSSGGIPAVTPSKKAYGIDTKKKSPGVGPVNISMENIAAIVEQANTPGTAMYNLFQLGKSKPNQYRQPPSYAKDLNPPKKKN